MPKRVDQHISSRLKGFTLIEVVVSLILLAAVMLLWRPVLLHVTRFTLQDHVLITSLQAEHDLQMFVRDKKLRSVALMSVRVRSPEKAYTINFYQTKHFRGMVRVMGSENGHMPLFTHLTGVNFSEVAQGFRYRLYLTTSQKIDGGVQIDEDTR